MQVAKWFKVLVIGGASMLAVACGEMESEPDPGREPSDSGRDSGGGMHGGMIDIGPASDAGEPQDSGIIQDAAAAQDAMVSQDAAAAPDAMVSQDAATPDTGVVLMCSMQANPVDPCGCPCCWAVGFLNTDPECAGFCGSGNNGMGCCE